MGIGLGVGLGDGLGEDLRDGLGHGLGECPGLGGAGLAIRNVVGAFWLCQGFFMYHVKKHINSYVFLNIMSKNM